MTLKMARSTSNSAASHHLDTLQIIIRALPPSLSLLLVALFRSTVLTALIRFKLRLPATPTHIHLSPAGIWDNFSLLPSRMHMLWNLIFELHMPRTSTTDSSI